MLQRLSKNELLYFKIIFRMIHYYNDTKRLMGVAKRESFRRS